MDDFICPISREIMTDPVVAADGFTYDRASIKKWFKKSNISPMTNEEINTDLIINYSIRSVMASKNYQLKSILPKPKPKCTKPTPSRYISPFTCFTNESRDNIRKINAAKEAGEKPEKFIGFIELSNKWTAFTDAEKAPYIEMSRISRDLPTS